MAKKKDRKKQKKRLKEQKQADRNDRIASARARASLYPRIVLRPEGGAPAFVAAVQQLANEFDFESPACCQERHRIIFKMFRAVGIREMLRRMDISSREASQAGFEPQLVEATIIDPLMLHVGKWIFARLSDEYRKSPLPFHSFTVVPRDNERHVLFRFLPTVSTEHGTVYFAPAGPKVAFGGGQWKVGFFRHAIDRVCERLCAVENIGYAHFNLCEIYFRNCIYYEPLELPDGQHAIHLFKEGRSATRSRLSASGPLVGASRLIGRACIRGRRVVVAGGGGWCGRIEAGGENTAGSTPDTSTSTSAIRTRTSTTLCSLPTSCLAVSPRHPTPIGGSFRRRKSSDCSSLLDSGSSPPATVDGVRSSSAIVDRRH